MLKKMHGPETKVINDKIDLIDHYDNYEGVCCCLGYTFSYID